MNFKDLFQYDNSDNYYKDIDSSERGVLINADCMNVLSKLDDESVNITLTDIPYNGVNKVKEGGLRKLNKGNADILTFDLNKFLDELYRVTKGTIIIFCNTTQISDIANYYYYMNELGAKISLRQLVWKKTNPSPINGQYNYLSGLENAIWVKKKGQGVFNAHCKSNVFEFPCGRSKLHPTEKNHDLIKDLILDNSNEDDIIFDPCCGSGSHCLCAKELNRRYLGIELNDDFYKIAKNRFI